MIENVLFLAKLLILLVLLFIARAIYLFIYIPWSVRQRYSKYPNVFMAEKFHPMLGDTAIMKKCVAEKKA